MACGTIIGVNLNYMMKIETCSSNSIIMNLKTGPILLMSLLVSTTLTAFAAFATASYNKPILSIAFFTVFSIVFEMLRPKHQEPS